MKQFSDFNIKTTSKGFEGNKIKMSKLLNKEILVYDFIISDSKVFKEKGSGKCLQLQISLNNEKHVVFTSASGLIEAIEQIPSDEFPFSTVIIEMSDRFKFS